jgi:hypothetical protein
MRRRAPRLMYGLVERRAPNHAPRRHTTNTMRHLAFALLLTSALAASGCATGGGAPHAGTHLAPPVDTIVIAVQGGEIWIDGDCEGFQAGRAALRQWITDSAAAVSAFYGRFPERYLRVQPVRADGGRVGFASVRTEPQMPRITINIGQQCSSPALAADWVLVHEMVHLAYPDQEHKHHWIEEGLATYIEPLCGIATGRTAPKELWGVMVDKLPLGLPEEGDEGLDRTHTWGRTYWGGALFCLMADIEIRKQTGNRRGLRDAMRGLVEAGGRMSWSWPMRKALRIADAATGTTVLWDLYEAWKFTPVQVDLDALWADLGVVRDGAEVRFNDDAPLAHIRRAITSCANSD